MADIDFSLDAQELRDQIARLTKEVDDLTLARDRFLDRVAEAEKRHEQSSKAIGAYATDTILERNGGSSDAALLSTSSSSSTKRR